MAGSIPRVSAIGGERNGSAERSFPRIFERDRQGEQQHRHECEQCGFGDSLVHPEYDADRCQHQQHGDVGQHAAVVAWVGFAHRRQTPRAALRDGEQDDMLRTTDWSWR